MKKIVIYFFLLFVLSSFNFAQIKINIIVSSNNIDSTEKVFIAGNKPELGNWNPGVVSLLKINDSIFTKEFSFNKNDSLEFKFTKGNWNNEALNENGRVPGNYIIKVLSDTTIYFRINNWNDSKIFIAGKITGEVRYHFNFEARKILSRDVIVLLPPGYDSLLEKYYPVLYMQDGQNIFDPATSAFGADWRIDETSDSLIKANEIDEIIIVGIYNTYKRGEEYSPTVNGYNYMQFIVEELKPFIDKTYKTMPDRNNTAVAGSSSGGLISFMMIWEYPDIFSKGACVSPALKISNIDYVSKVKNYSGLKKPINIYIDNGGVGIEEKLQAGIDEMLLALKEKSYAEGNDLFWFKDAEAEHNEKAWSKRAHIFLKYLFPKK